MSKIHQSDAVLRELRTRPRGVHSFELRLMFIGNPSQRITELEQRGHVISHTRERLHGQAIGMRYVLVKDAERTQEAA